MEIKELKVKDFIYKTLIETKEYKELTPIQEKIIPLALLGKNVIGKSATGSGKTDAFLTPVFNNIDPSNEMLQAIIIAPTRELAAQIYENSLDYVKNNEKIKVKLYTGGFERKKDLTNTSAHIVIGTPARLKDVLVSNGLYNVSTTKMIVLDEIDMIFEMKFLNDIDVIMSLLNENVQTLAFSATINNQLKYFISKYMQTKEIVEIGKNKQASETISHFAISIKSKTRIMTLLELVDIINPYFCLIFASKKEDVNKVFKALREKGLNVGLLHGDLESRSRRQTMKKVNEFEYQYLVCSDIASRGIDIRGASQVINYDFPTHLEYYFHRSGRCGRASESGECFSLYDNDDLVTIKQLINKGLEIENVEIKNGMIKNMTPFIREKRTKKLDEKLEVEIKKIVNKAKNKKQKVQPGYKKKIKLEIDKAKRKRKREIIKEDIKKRQKERAIKRSKGEL